MASSNDVVPVDQIQQYLESRQDRIAAALPQATDLTPGRVVRLVLTEMRKNQQLMKCRVPSLLASMIQAAQLGLEPGSGRGLAYLVPYKGECTLIIGYRGFIELAERSGKIGQVMARVVRESDEFSVEYEIGGSEGGQVEHVRHVPNFSADANEPIKAVYAYAARTDGHVVVDVMTRSEIEAIRARSMAGNSGPWITDYNEMARKTVVRRLAKYLPLSPELERAVTVDEAAERGEPASDYLEGDWSDLSEADGGGDDEEAAPEPGSGTERARTAVTAARKKTASKTSAKKAASKKKASARAAAEPHSGDLADAGDGADAQESGDAGPGGADAPADSEDPGAGPSDGELFNECVKGLGTIADQGDVDEIDRRLDLARGIGGERYRQQCMQQLEDARERAEAAQGAES